MNLVGAVGFELTTLCSQSRCATRLRYAPKGGDYTRNWCLASAVPDPAVSRSGP